MLIILLASSLLYSHAFDAAVLKASLRPFTVSDAGTVIEAMLALCANYGEACDQTTSSPACG